jgi:RNA polymerase sigma-70 factor (ECF subfamily)
MPARTPELDELRRLMHHGDAAALDRLARAYGPRLLAVAHRRCRCQADAEDAVQNALVDASTSLTRYRGDGSPLAWLSSIVAHNCARLNRDPRNDPARTVHDDVERASDGDPEDRALMKELGDEIGAALMALSRTDRLLFLLAAEGDSSDDIAAQFDLTSDAVRSRLKRARRILRSLVTHGASAPAQKGHEPRHRPPRRLQL